MGFRAQDASFLAGKHIIFVAGFMNELTHIINNYFIDNMIAVEMMGATFDYITPSSKLSIAKNALLINNQIIGICNKQKKPSIIFADSKAGAEVLHMILEHPDLILKGYIERVLLVQPAIGGSSLASNASSMLYTVVSSFLSPNINTLSRHATQATFNTVFSHYHEMLKTLSKTEHD